MNRLLLIIVAVLLFSITINALENNEATSVAIPSSKTTPTEDDIKLKQLEEFCIDKSKEECKLDGDKSCEEIHKNTCIAVETKWIQYVEQECACMKMECEDNKKKCDRKIARCQRSCVKNACKARAFDECKDEEKSKKCMKKSRKGCYRAHLHKNRNHKGDKHKEHHGNKQEPKFVANDNKEMNKLNDLPHPISLIPPKNNPQEEKKQPNMRGIRKFCKKILRARCQNDKKCIQNSEKECEQKESEWRKFVLSQCTCENKSVRNNVDNKDLPTPPVPTPSEADNFQSKCQRRCIKEACKSRAVEECKDDQNNKKKTKKCVKKFNKRCRRAHVLRAPRGLHNQHVQPQNEGEDNIFHHGEHKMNGEHHNEHHGEHHKEHHGEHHKEHHEEHHKEHHKEHDGKQHKEHHDGKHHKKGGEKKDKKGGDASRERRTLKKFCKKRSKRICKGDKQCVASKRQECEKIEDEWKSSVLARCDCTDKKTRNNKNHNKLSKCQRKCVKKACKSRASEECDGDKKCQKKFNKGCKKVHLGNKKQHKKNKYHHKSKNSNKEEKRGVEKKVAGGVRRMCNRKLKKQCGKDKKCLAEKRKQCEQKELEWRVNTLKQCDCEAKKCSSDDKEVCEKKLAKCAKKCLKRACKQRVIEECSEGDKKCVKKAKGLCKKAHTPKNMKKQLKSLIGTIMKNILLKSAH